MEVATRVSTEISIHAPREGSDAQRHLFRLCHALFQSTLPVRGATCLRRAEPAYRLISIHAPREGSDLVADGLVYDFFGISIHAPREGSDYGRCSVQRRRIHFNPRSP